MRCFGLIGRSLGHSASAEYFAEKFGRERIDASYELFELPNIGDVSTLPHNIDGFNVTIPYKREIIPYLDEISDEAAAVGAVNCVDCRNGRRVGYNTDVEGVRYALDRLLPGKPDGIKALVLGTGGAAQSVRYVLEERGTDYAFVSRIRRNGVFSYEELTSEIIYDHRLIINTTPVGMFPHTDEAPQLPYAALSAEHFLFDAIYNPPITRFLQYGSYAGARVANGRDMFVAQAEASWRIWNADHR